VEVEGGYPKEYNRKAITANFPYGGLCERCSGHKLSLFQIGGKRIQVSSIEVNHRAGNNAKR